MSFITKAFEQIGKGISHAFKATGEIAKGVLTLDIKGAARGVSHLAASQMEIGRGALNVTPAALCANTLLDGALDKLVEKTQQFGLSVANGVINTMANDLVLLQRGVFMMAEGVFKGNLAEVAQGVAQTTDGLRQVQRDFTPKGLSENTARSVVNTVVNGPQKVD